MEKIVKFAPYIFIVFIFKNWLLSPFLSARDFPYFFSETLTEWPIFPPEWSSILSNGFGGEHLLYALDSYIYFIVNLFVNSLGLPWVIVYKVFIFGLFVFLSIVSSQYLLKKTLNNPNRFQMIIASFLFTINTYILMVVDGGQIGVALAYSIAPLVLGKVISLIDSSLNTVDKLKMTFQNAKSVKKSIITSLVLALQVLFDLRIAIITFVIGMLYILFFYFFVKRFSIRRCFFHFILIIFVVLGLHVYWLFPAFFSHSHPAQELFNNGSSLEGFRFFSFATFSQTVSLLHPNWPENIFGKIYFMGPEFLILPILAYSGLFFIQRISQKYAERYAEQRRILFFALLGLCGAFLAKGAHDPFGAINIWIFSHIPFSSLFRDPTKFYLLVAIAYSVLIPFSVYYFSNWIVSKVKNQKSKISFDLFESETLQSRRPEVLKTEGQSKYQIFNVSYVFLIFPILYLLFLIHPVFLNQLSGTFAKHEIPKEYIDLKNFLHAKKSFSRTLWIPIQQRYNFYSYLHPAVSADKLFHATNSAEVIKKFSVSKSQEMLSRLSVKYIIVPYDSFGEIFVKDRKYNPNEYQNMVDQLDKIDWIKRVSGFEKIAVFELPSYKDHFWLDGEGDLSYKQISTAEYEITVSIKKPTTLVFTDTYNPYWVARVGGEKLTSRRMMYNSNGFELEKAGPYTLTVYFSKQKYYFFGKLITLSVIGFLLFVILYKKKL